MSEYLVPFEDVESEFVEKRSRFISHLWRVESEAEARARIEEMKKKYYDARHNCWCYLLKEGNVVRYSDDGEPQGTAGQPMLNPVFWRYPVGSGRSDPSLYQRGKGCVRCGRHCSYELVDVMGCTLYIPAV